MFGPRPSRPPRQRAPQESSGTSGRLFGWLLAAFLVCWAFVLGVLVGQGSLATPEQVAWVKQALGLERLLGSEPPPSPQRLTDPQLSFYERVKEQRQTPAAPPAKPSPAPHAKPPEAAPASSVPATTAPAAPTAPPAQAAKPAPAVTAPATASAPAPSAAPAAPANGGEDKRFTVQVASFSDKEQALTLVRRLQDGGYPAYTLIVEVQGAGRRFRVRVGPYAQLDAAQGAASRIRLQHKLAAYVTRRE